MTYRELAGAALSVVDRSRLRRLEGMSLRVVHPCVLVAAVAGACVSSAAQVREAREARYTGDRTQLFGALRDAVAADYVVASATAEPAQVVTVGQLYSGSGERVGSAGPPDPNDSPSVRRPWLELSFEVSLLGVAPPYQIVVTALTAEERAPDWRGGPLRHDPDVPDWVTEQRDDLAIALHHRLRRFLAPPPPPPPPPAP